jgi:hypothetical protein
MILLSGDSEAISEIEKGFVRQELPFTAISGAVGEGKSGLRSGDRIHPGGVAVFFTVVADDRIDSAVDRIAAERNRLGADEMVKIFVLPVERML